MNARQLEEYLDEDEAFDEASQTLTIVRPRHDAPIPQHGFYRRYGKRAFDLVVSLPLCLLLLPLVLLIAAAVLLTSGWPPFYRARRVGRGGREFSMWKIRSMVRDADKALADWQCSNPALAAEYAQHFKLRDDPRVTRLGRFLRRSSLDELPQLWNVMRGDMSLVGPRPIVAEELAHYRSRAAELLSVRPGITGSWQLNGRNNVAYPERIWLELAACHSSGLSSDISVLARTLTVPLKFNGL